MGGNAKYGDERTDFRGGKAISRKMNAGNACGKRDIQPVVYQYTSGRSSREVSNTANQFEEFARGQVLFTYLNEVDAILDCPSRRCQHIASPAIRDITANHCDVRLNKRRDFQKRCSSD